MIDVSALHNYVSSRNNSEILEDVAQFIDLNIVSSAIDSTFNGCQTKLPMSSLSEISQALKVYRDELGVRSIDSDKPEESGYTLLKNYYQCVKVIRSLDKYIDRFRGTSAIDYAPAYTRLAESKESTSFAASKVED